MIVEFTQIANHALKFNSSNYPKGVVWVFHGEEIYIIESWSNEWANCRNLKSGLLNHFNGSSASSYYRKVTKLTVEV